MENSAPRETDVARPVSPKPTKPRHFRRRLALRAAIEVLSFEAMDSYFPHHEIGKDIHYHRDHKQDQSTVD
jgi:hypothetical protein